LGTIGLLAAVIAKAFRAKEVFVSDIIQVTLGFARDSVECKTFVLNLEFCEKEIVLKTACIH
jgi:threonine dehydrogenase-like Zn-dependent dehydrogenase